jgi:hypothetical protein
MNEAEFGFSAEAAATRKKYYTVCSLADRGSEVGCSRNRPRNSVVLLLPGCFGAVRRRADRGGEAFCGKVAKVSSSLVSKTSRSLKKIT